MAHPLLAAGRYLRIRGASFGVVLRRSLGEAAKAGEQPQMRVQIGDVPLQAPAEAQEIFRTGGAEETGQEGCKCRVAKSRRSYRIDGEDLRDLQPGTAMRRQVPFQVRRSGQYRRRCQILDDHGMEIACDRGPDQEIRDFMRIRGICRHLFHAAKVAGNDKGIVATGEDFLQPNLDFAAIADEVEPAVDRRCRPSRSRRQSRFNATTIAPAGRQVAMLDNGAGRPAADIRTRPCAGLRDGSMKSELG